jgi:hypothetical protein
MIPILIITVELKVVSSRHAINCQDPIITIHSHILVSSDWRGHCLFKVMHLINILVLIPEAIRSINKDQVLIFIVYHFGYIIEVTRSLEQSKHRKNVHSVRRPNNRTLHLVVQAHVIVIIYVSLLFKSPSSTILELLWDLPEIPIIAHPR